jgi:serine/threonine-protein kinase
VRDSTLTSFCRSRDHLRVAAMTAKPPRPTSTPPAPLAKAETLTLVEAPVPIASGDRIAGRYTVVELYGAGPLGYAFRAIDRDESAVAIKVLHPALVPTERERLAALSELEKLSGRALRGVALPIDAGTAGRFAYVVSPWIQGRSLRRVLGAFRDAGLELPASDVHGVLAGVVDALRELHASFVHGAVYPENVQISTDGRIVLTDAGLVGSIARARWLEHLEYFTDVLPYVSPELHKGRPMTASSDLWAVGALASELLTGHPASVREGIAPAMLGTWPRSVASALSNMVAAKVGMRATALPMLLREIAQAIPAKTLPRTGALPEQRARTEVLLTPGTLPNEGTSPGIALVSRGFKRHKRP